MVTGVTKKFNTEFFYKKFEKCDLIANRMKAFE